MSQPTTADQAHDNSWMARGACRNGVDPDVFYVPEGWRGQSKRARIESAKRVCMGCEVRAECMAYALDSGEFFGVWGGLSEEERRALRGEQELASDDGRDEETVEKLMDGGVVPSASIIDVAHAVTRLYEIGGWTRNELAARFGVYRRSVDHWIRRASKGQLPISLQQARIVRQREARISRALATR